MRLLLFVILFFSSPMSLAEGGPARDKMLWGYAEFLTAVQAGDWETAERFVSDESRIGFGPAEGKAGFQEQVVDDAECLKDLVFALKQGCRLDTVLARGLRVGQGCVASRGSIRCRGGSHSRGQSPSRRSYTM